MQEGRVGYYLVEVISITSPIAAAVRTVNAPSSKPLAIARIFNHKPEYNRDPIYKCGRWIVP